MINKLAVADFVKLSKLCPATILSVVRVTSSVLGARTPKEKTLTTNAQINEIDNIIMTAIAGVTPDASFTLRWW